MFFQESFPAKGQLRLYADRCHLSWWEEKVNYPTESMAFMQSLVRSSWETDGFIPWLLQLNGYKTPVKPSKYRAWRVFCFVRFSWCFFYFLVFAKTFLISPRVRIRFPKSISVGTFNIYIFVIYTACDWNIQMWHLLVTSYISYNKAYKSARIISENLTKKYRLYKSGSDFSNI